MTGNLVILSSSGFAAISEKSLNVDRKYQLPTIVLYDAQQRDSGDTSVDGGTWRMMRNNENQKSSKACQIS